MKRAFGASSLWKMIDRPLPKCTNSRPRVEDAAIAGSGTLGTEQLFRKSPEGAKQTAPPFQGLHIRMTEPRAPAGFAACALGSPAPRFQSSGRCSNRRIDDSTREFAGCQEPRRGAAGKPRVEDAVIAGSGTLGTEQLFRKSPEGAKQGSGRLCDLCPGPCCPGLSPLRRSS